MKELHVCLSYLKFTLPLEAQEGCVPNCLSLPLKACVLSGQSCQFQFSGLGSPIPATLVTHRGPHPPLRRSSELSRMLEMMLESKWLCYRPQSVRKWVANLKSLSSFLCICSQPLFELTLGIHTVNSTTVRQKEHIIVVSQYRAAPNQSHKVSRIPVMRVCS